MPGIEPELDMCKASSLPIGPPPSLKKDTIYYFLIQEQQLNLLYMLSLCFNHYILANTILLVVLLHCLNILRIQLVHKFSFVYLKTSKADVKT